MSTYRPVNAVLRAIDVLVALNRLKGQGTVRELHDLTGIDKATVQRMLETLIHAGLVTRSEEDKICRLTGKTMSLSSGYDRPKAIGRLVASRLSEFRTEIGWPSDVAVFDYDAMVVAETSRQNAWMSFNRQQGYRAPILATSIGLAYTAYCSDGERESILNRLKDDPAPWNELARDSRMAEAIFAKIRDLGYATMRGEYSTEEYDGAISSIGIPVMKQGKVFAAMNIIYLKKAVPEEKIVRDFLGLLQSTADAMADDLMANWEQ